MSKFKKEALLKNCSNNKESIFSQKTLKKENSTKFFFRNKISVKFPKNA